MAVITMSVSEWCAVKDNPRQRDTVRRAKYAARNHLKEYSPLHRFVYAATKDGRVLCKLDGHTRAYLWECGVLSPPEDGSCDVLLVPCRSLKHAANLYEHLDNAKARKQPHDEVFSALRESGVQLNSSLLHRCAFSNQLKMAKRFTCKGKGCDTNALTKEFIQELVALDGASLSRTYTILIGLMLATIRLDGAEQSLPFWKALDDDNGIKRSGKMDGVEALSQHVRVRKAEHKTSGWDNLDDLFRRGLTAYVSWKSGKLIKGLRVTDPDVVFATTKVR